MDIVCPNCAAGYEIDDTTLTDAGRKVRCAACSTVWRAYPVRADPDATRSEAQSEHGVAGEDPPDGGAPADHGSEGGGSAADHAGRAAIADEPPTTPAAPRGAKWRKDGRKEAPAGGRLRRLLGWPSATLAATALIALAVWHQRECVVRLAPQTAALYAAVGIPVNLRGIEIRNVASRIVADGEDQVLVVDGDLVNITDARVAVPRLLFTITGANGQQLYAWSAQADRSNLQPGEKLNFRRRLAAPPSDGQQVSVRFLLPSDTTAGIR